MPPQLKEEYLKRLTHLFFMQLCKTHKEAVDIICLSWCCSWTHSRNFELHNSVRIEPGDYAYCAVDRHKDKPT